MSNKLGFSGVAGSFSEEAAIYYAKKSQVNYSLIALKDMEGVLCALNQGTVDLGILPVVNLQGGLVHQSFHAMGRYDFEFIDDLWLEIKHCLLVLAGMKKEEITAIASHPQGFLQCKHYLNKHFPTAQLIESVNTAQAARDLVEGRLSATTAVIASERAAYINHLEILSISIQDITPNLTAFIVVQKKSV